MTLGTTILHDPTSERSPTRRPRRTPPTTLDGRTVALLDLGKIRSDEFLDHVEQAMTLRGVSVFRTAKPTNAKMAPPHVLDEIVARADVVVEALAD